MLSLKLRNLEDSSMDQARNHWGLLSKRPSWGAASCFLAAAVVGMISAVPSVLGDPPLPVIPNATFDVTSYGASGNGSTVDTTAIQNAINAASAAGGGTVLVPDSGSGVFLAGALTLASNINLDVATGATLEMLSKSQYGSTSTPFISANHVSNVEISGAGAINGDGSTWWADPSSPRPFLIEFQNSSTVAVENITLQNSPMEHLTFDGTNDVTINGITISAPSNSPNTDGIDPSGSNYLIENSTISTGDDDIAVKPQNTTCSNIVINNMAIGTGHGISVGGQTNDGLNGLTVSNVTFNGTSNGLRLKAGAGYGGLVQNVSYSNIRMTNVAMPIAITSFYANGGDNFPTDPTAVTAATLNSTTPLWKNISFNGITATGASQDGLIYGEPLTGSGAPATNFNGLTLNNVNISGYQGLGIYYVQNLDLGTGNTFAAQSGPGLSTYGDTVAVPEPAAGLLLAVGASALVGMCGGRKDRKIAGV
jgi:polygalacturonase